MNVVRADVYYKQAYVNFHNTALQTQDRGDPEGADGYFELALLNYDRAISLNPGDDYYLLFRGKGLLERADAKAQAAEKDLLPLRGENANFSEYAVADANARQAVEDRDRAYEQALSALERARAAAPLNTDHTANLARAYKFWGDRTLDPTRRAERFTKSRAYYDEAIQQSPNNAGLREELATTNYLAGDIPAALAGISDTLKVDPKYTKPLRLLATIQRERGDFADAERSYQTYVDSRDGRSDALAWSGLAIVLGKQGKFDEALAANDKVLQLVPNDLDTLRNQVLLARDLGDMTRACAAVRQALEAHPDDEGMLGFEQELGCGGEAPPAGAPTPEATTAP
jgi:tetratricopeptide (TPR) repeat protein